METNSKIMLEIESGTIEFKITGPSDLVSNPYERVIFNPIYLDDFYNIVYYEYRIYLMGSTMRIYFFSYSNAGWQKAYVSNFNFIKKKLICNYNRRWEFVDQPMIFSNKFEIEWPKILPRQLSNVCERIYKFFQNRASAILEELFDRDVLSIIKLYSYCTDIIR